MSVSRIYSSYEDLAKFTLPKIKEPFITPASVATELGALDRVQVPGMQNIPIAQVVYKEKKAIIQITFDKEIKVVDMASR